MRSNIGADKHNFHTDNPTELEVFKSSSKHVVFNIGAQSVMFHNGNNLFPKQLADRGAAAVEANSGRRNA